MGVRGRLACDDETRNEEAAVGGSRLPYRVLPVTCSSTAVCAINNLPVEVASDGLWLARDKNNGPKLQAPLTHA